jgi:mobilome CxxCx(11)CxxC protein
LLRWLSFWGLVLPVLVGGVVIAFGTEGSYLKYLLAAVGIVGIVQLILSLWSIVASWADNLQYSLESAAENFDLSAKFKELGQQAQDPPDGIEVRYAELKARDDSRRIADAKRAPKAKELRYAHRAGLRQFQRSCEGCHTIPVSMEPTECDICGRF